MPVLLRGFYLVIGTALFFGVSTLVLIAFAIYRADVRERRRLAQDSARADRELALRERELSLREQSTKNPPLPRLDEFPPALRRLADAESEEFARNDVVRIVQEEWLSTDGDWEKTASRVFARFRGTAERSVQVVA